MNPLYYIIIVVVLLACELVYFKIADRYNIIDKPNERSSHTAITLRGGGIIFAIAMLLDYIIFHSSIIANAYLYLTIGMCAISAVSLWDDISSLSNKVRLLVHLISVSLLLYATGAFQAYSIWAIVMAYVLIIGTINAYNFMDGINGITGLYSLVVFIAAWYCNKHIAPVIAPDYIIMGMLACIVFLFFNFRKKAKCFAGDVGSVGIAFWVISILLFIIIATEQYKYIFFVALYGVDTVLTIMHRLLLKQNIFEAHRLHFYQILANNRKVPHLVVATIYALLQLGINAFVIHTNYSFLTTGLLVCIPLALLYVVLKPKLMSDKLG
jgi:UDP-N-acetylmuramyl pentapeptide phosphotransferase/UDP-N-acetylglucosamine-1-phosphate transferase